MNLLNRLKPHYKEKLSQFNLKDSQIVDQVSTCLENEQYVHNLKYGTIIDLYVIFGSMNVFYLFEELKS